MSHILQIVVSILTLVGALGLFLYGMKLLSEALQKVAGPRLRNLLKAMTSNRFKGIVTGVLVTVIIQSSSATTVMLVSFVNAGLLTLTQAVGVIMGANIGTTVTAWIISLVGFEMDLGSMALPLLGLGVPLLFLKRSNLHSIGEMLLGFSLLFLGLMFLKNSVPDLSLYPEILEVLSHYTHLGIWSILLFVVIGIGLTVVIQSSSATMALTLLMCANGWIDFSMAAAMILGENVGTTITAVVAASIGNTSARQAALFHFVFNVLGVIWVLIIFTPFIRFVDYIAQVVGIASPTVNPSSTPIALSLFHTCFNIVNTLVMVWFTPQLVSLVKRLLPLKENEDEEYRLRFIGHDYMPTGELALLSVWQEVSGYARRVHRMFGFVQRMLDPTNDKELERIYERILKYENISDRMEVEIGNYLGKLQTSELSDSARLQVNALMKIISEIESVADCCHNAGKILKRKSEANLWFNQYIQKHIDVMIDLVDRSFTVMISNLTNNAAIDFEAAKKCEEEINSYRNELKRAHLKNVENGVYSYQAGVFYSDLYSQCERMGDYIVNVSEDINEMNFVDKAIPEDEEDDD
ncbi:MAG: Na/Pi cotransporter family protein [Bacteroides sp.]